MSPAAILALALLAPGEGIYLCSASERIEPGTWAAFQSRIEDGAARLPSFHIRYVTKPREVITQQMEWYDLPRWNEHLGAPDTIGFALPIRRPDPKGYLRFSAGGRSWAAPQYPRFVRALRHFDSSWVEFQEFEQRNKFWEGSGWKVEAVDRRGRVMGTIAIRMPGPERIEAAYARLRADLMRFESDPRKHCEYFPPPDPADFPRDESDITVSGSSDPA